MKTKNHFCKKKHFYKNYEVEFFNKIDKNSEVKFFNNITILCFFHQQFLQTKFFLPKPQNWMRNYNIKFFRFSPKSQNHTFLPKLENHKIDFPKPAKIVKRSFFFTQNYIFLPKL